MSNNQIIFMNEILVQSLFGSKIDQFWMNIKNLYIQPKNRMIKKRNSLNIKQNFKDGEKIYFTNE